MMKSIDNTVIERDGQYIGQDRAKNLEYYRYNDKYYAVQYRQTSADILTEHRRVHEPTRDEMIRLGMIDDET